ncbi:MAG: Gfo/Idh/MocA family oxidoreductase [Planctomycetota bacterium]|nr:Gfo/Idh/MocA family oxidoreductase [Planctomycetota bacterium]
MKETNSAVIGAGHLGKIHAKLLGTIEGVKPLVVETDEMARAFVESELGIPTLESIDDLPAGLEGVIVVTPTATHYDIASEMVSRGCHLLVEKPVCADATSSAQLCEMAERQKRVLQVGHVERFNPAFVAAKPFMSNVKLVECTRFTPYTFRATDVSVIHDLMIHDIDLLLSIMQSDVISVSATGNSIIGPQLDSATAWIEFADGTKACLKSSRCSHVADRSMRVETSRGYVNVDFANQTVETMTAIEGVREPLNQLSRKEKEIAKKEMFEKWLPVENVLVSPQNAILEEQKEFVHCINRSQQPTVTGRDGLAAVELAEKIVAAIESQQQVILKKDAA